MYVLLTCLLTYLLSIRLKLLHGVSFAWPITGKHNVIQQTESANALSSEEDQSTATVNI